MHRLLLVVVLLGVSLSASAKPNPVEQRVKELSALVCADPKGHQKLFTEAFLQAIPPARAREILREFFTKAGPVVSTVRTATKGPFAAEYRFYSKTSIFPVKIAVTSRPPHLIQSLWFGSISRRLQSLEEVTAGLKALPGQVSFAVCQLGGKQPRAVASLNPDLPLALGSAFKLYVLGALVQGIQDGKRRWDEVVTLREDWKSWPSGKLHTWPAGVPVTLSTLAALMISISDNTATDHLLLHLGRDAVEAMLVPMGVKQPDRNRPFLTTREAFLLDAASARRAEFVKRDSAGRREYLDQTIARLPYSKDLSEGEARPTNLFEQVEWYGSASDLCRAFDWLRTKASAPSTKLALETLAINRTSLVFRDSAWRYVGYKGGSEPGVLNLSWLLQRKNGEWLVLTAGWNDPKKPLDEDKLLELLGGAVTVLEEKR